MYSRVVAHRFPLRIGLVFTICGALLPLADISLFVRTAHARRRVNPPPPPVPDDQFVQNFLTWAVLRAPSDSELTYWNGE